MSKQFEKLVELEKRMLKSKKDYDVLNFRSQYIKCITGKYGNTVKVQAYLLIDEIVAKIATMEDEKFQKLFLKSL